MKRLAGFIQDDSEIRWPLKLWVLYKIKRDRHAIIASNLLLPDFFGGAVFAELSADQISGLSLTFRVTTYSLL